MRLHINKNDVAREQKMLFLADFTLQAQQLFSWPQQWSLWPETPVCYKTERNKCPNILMS